MVDRVVTVEQGRTIVAPGAEFGAAFTAGAEAARDAAQVAQGEAESFADQASLSASAAAAAGNMFPTTAAGVAAVAANAFFTTPGDGVSSYAILWQKVSGAAVKKAEFAAKSPFDVPGPTGGDDFAMIDAVLAAAAGTRAIVRLRPGLLYKTSDTLLIRAGSGFSLNGSTLRSISTTPKRVVSNPAMTAMGAAVTLAWTSGYEVTVTQAAHGLAVGDFAWLRGATQAHYRGVFPVIRVISAGSYVVALERTPSSAPTGSVTMVKADADISFDFGGLIDYNNAIKSVGAGYDTCAVYFAGVADFRQRHGTIIGAQKFAWALGAANGWAVDAPTVPASNSDACKVYGPSHNGDLANLSGLVGDDFLSLQPCEAAAYPGYQIDSGDVLGVTIRRLNQRGGLKAFTIYTTSTGPIVDGVTVDGVAGHPDIGSGAALIRVQCNDEETNGVAGSLTFRNVSGQGDAVLDFVKSKVREISLHLAGARPFSGSGSFVKLDAGSTVRTCRITGKVDATALTSPNLFVSDGGHVDLLDIAVDWEGPDGYLVTTSAANAFFGLILVRSGKIHMGNGTAVRFGGYALANEPRIEFRDLEELQGIRACEIRQSMSIDFDNVRGSLNDLIYCGGSVAGDVLVDIRVSSRRLVKPGADWLMSNGALTGPKFSVFSNDIPIAVNAANIARADGAFARNTATSGAGTITMAGIVDCTGTAAGSWSLRRDPVAQRF